MSDRLQRLKKERRYGIVPVDIEIMAQHLITLATGVRINGLPIDAVYITAFYAPDKFGLQFVYAHETFESLPEGTAAPILNVTYSKYEVPEALPNADSPRSSEVSDAK